jgi:hypothetical protein
MATIANGPQLKPNNNVHVLLQGLQALLALGTGVAIGDLALDTEAGQVALQWSGGAVNGKAGFAQVGSKRATCTPAAGAGATVFGGALFVFKLPQDGVYVFRVAAAVTEGPTIGPNTNGGWSFITGGVRSVGGVASIIAANVTDQGWDPGMGTTPSVTVTASGSGLVVTYNGTAGGGGSPAVLASCSVYLDAVMPQHV